MMKSTFFLSAVLLFVAVDQSYGQRYKPCMTNSGPQPKKECVFPWTYQGKVLNTCKSMGHGITWCATKVDDKGVYHRSTNQWGFCDGAESCSDPSKRAPTKKPATKPKPKPSDPKTSCVTTGGPSTGMECKLPFKYGGKTSKGCLPHGRRTWCATQVDSNGNYDSGSKKWGYCPNTEFCKTGEKPNSTGKACLTTSSAGAGAGKKCILPFKIAGKTFKTCKKSGRRSWCAVAVKSDGVTYKPGGKSWAYCSKTPECNDPKVVAANAAAGAKPTKKPEPKPKPATQKPKPKPQTKPATQKPKPKPKPKPSAAAALHSSASVALSQIMETVPFKGSIKATSSGWYKNYRSRRPENAVDGQTKTYYTSDNGLNWLQLDLGKEMTVEGVMVQKRSRYEILFRYVEVRVGDDDVKGESGKKVLSKNAVCAKLGDSNRNKEEKMECKKPLKGRYITIQPYKRNALNIAEVKVLVNVPKGSKENDDKAKPVDPKVIMAPFCKKLEALTAKFCEEK